MDAKSSTAILVAGNMKNGKDSSKELFQSLVSGISVHGATSRMRIVGTMYATNS